MCSARSCPSSVLHVTRSRTSAAASVLLVSLLMLAVSGPGRLVHGAVDPASTLKCHIRTYTYVVSKPYTLQDGTVLPCYDNVTVDTCWGRCDSSEIPDYRTPYKMSNHPVCTYSQMKVPRPVKLRYCHPDHPKPFTEVFDARACRCQACSPNEANCETIPGK